MNQNLKRKLLFVLGAYVVIGLIDSRTDQLVFAEIYNPMDPSEEIIPIDSVPSVPEPKEDQPEPPINPEPEPEPEDELPAEDWEEQIRFSSGHNAGKIIRMNDLFLEEEHTPEIAFSEDDSGSGSSGNEEQPNYLAKLAQVFSGKVIYGQNSTGGTKQYVHSIFE